MPAERERPTVVRNDEEAEMTAQSFDTVIVGGGQAGSRRGTTSRSTAARS